MKPEKLNIKKSDIIDILSSQQALDLLLAGDAEKWGIYFDTEADKLALELHPEDENSFESYLPVAQIVFLVCPLEVLPTELIDLGCTADELGVWLWSKSAELGDTIDQFAKDQNVEFNFI